MGEPTLIYRWRMGHYDADGWWRPGAWAILSVNPPEDSEVGASFDEGQYRRLHALRTQHGRGERNEWLGQERPP